MKTAILFVLALAGVAAAFFRPAEPYQVQEAVSTPAFLGKDFELDNPSVPEDKSIHPARKCGFCMGVSAYSNSSFRWNQVSPLTFCVL